MGVLNITPDSFSDGGHFFEPQRAIEHGLQMAEEGADIIDVGGESSQPGSDPVPLDEELKRVIPVIEGLVSCLEIPISVDTYKSQVAEQAIEAGAQMINDISGLHFDPQIPAVAARYDTPLIIMHIKGTPKTMQQNPSYEDLMGEIVACLREGIEKAERGGVDPQQVIVDPGIGFGKRVQDNLVIINRLDEYLEVEFTFVRSDQLAELLLPLKRADQDFILDWVKRIASTQVEVETYEIALRRIQQGTRSMLLLFAGVESVIAVVAAIIDNLHGTDLGCPGYRAAREGGLKQVDAVLALPQSALYGRSKVEHSGEDLQNSQLGNLNRTIVTYPA